MNNHTLDNKSLLFLTSAFKSSLEPNNPEKRKMTKVLSSIDLEIFNCWSALKWSATGVSFNIFLTSSESTSKEK